MPKQLRKIPLYKSATACHTIKVEVNGRVVKKDLHLL